MYPQSNGNLITDSGKGITTPIAYNHLNLPRQITASAGTFTHTYTATGQKLRMTVPPSGAEGAKTVDYAAGLVYENSSLAFIPTAEGRILPPTKAVNPEVLPGDANALKNSFYRYEYHLKDHLGNLRVACRCAEIANATSPRDSYAPIAVQENHYDAWGLALPLTEQNANLAGSPEHRWQYNGKENVPDLGWYEYGFRWYAPDRARFLQIDPLAENFNSISAYSYAANNPILFVDKEGAGPDLPPMWAYRRMLSYSMDFTNSLLYANNTSPARFYEWIQRGGYIKDSAFGKFKGAFGEAIAMQRIRKDFDISLNNGISINPLVGKVNIQQDIAFYYGGIKYQVDVSGFYATGFFGVKLPGTNSKDGFNLTLGIKNNRFDGVENNMAIFGKDDSRRFYRVNYEVKTLSANGSVQSLFEELSRGINQTIDRGQGARNIGVLVVDRDAWLRVANDETYGSLLQTLYNELTKENYLRLENGLSSEAIRGVMGMKNYVTQKP